MIIYYVPLVIMLCIISICYIATIIHLAKKLQTTTLLHNAASVRDNPNMTQSVYDNYNRYKTLQRELIIYLICIVLCRIWGVVSSIQKIITPDQSIEWIILLYSFFAPLQGFVNTFLFFNSTIRKRIRHSTLCSKWPFLNDKSGVNEYQPLIESKTTTPTFHIEHGHGHNNGNNNNRDGAIGRVGVGNHLLDIDQFKRSSLPTNIGRSSKKNKHKTQNKYRRSNAHSGNTLAALISPPFHNVESSWPYPEAPNLEDMTSSDATQSLPNVTTSTHDILEENEKTWTKYTTLQNQDKIGGKNNMNPTNKRNKSFVEKWVNRLSISKKHIENAQALNEYIPTAVSSNGIGNNLPSKPYSTGHLSDNNKKNKVHHNPNGSKTFNDDQYKIYKDRFERIEADHNTSSQYLPESLNTTDWDTTNNTLKGSSGTFKFSPNRESKSQSPLKRDRKKRVIELDESKFEKDIIEQYSVFITTFNMVCFMFN